MDEGSEVQRIELEESWMELTIRSHVAGLPRCEKPSEDLSRICVVMLYGHLPHPMPCMHRDINTEKIDPKIITNVRRVALPIIGRDAELIPKRVTI